MEIALPIRLGDELVEAKDDDDDFFFLRRFFCLDGRVAAEEDGYEDGTSLRRRSDDVEGSVVPRRVSVPPQLWEPNRRCSCRPTRRGWT